MTSVWAMLGKIKRPAAPRSWSLAVIAVAQVSQRKRSSASIPDERITIKCTCMCVVELAAVVRGFVCSRFLALCHGDRVCVRRSKPCLLLAREVISFSCVRDDISIASGLRLLGTRCPFPFISFHTYSSNEYVVSVFSLFYLNVDF